MRFLSGSRSDGAQLEGGRGHDGSQPPAFALFPLRRSRRGRGHEASERIGPLYIYGDGRVIWAIGDGDPGYLQRRLTPEAVERLRTRAVSTGHPVVGGAEISPFVPSRLMVVFDHGKKLHWSTLPSPAREVIRNRLGGLTRGDFCQVISNDQAREIARALTQAGIDVDYRSQRGLLGFVAAGSFVHSSPALPHEVDC